MTRPHRRETVSAVPSCNRPLILFVCRHGAAKSVLAANQLRRYAEVASVAVDVSAAGVEPDAAIAPTVLEFLAGDIELPAPRQVTDDEIAGAWRTITFDLEPSDLPGNPDPADRWDGLPSAGEDPGGFVTALGPRIQRLLEELGDGTLPGEEGLEPSRS